jgi:hypothetical protein
MRTTFRQTRKHVVRVRPRRSLASRLLTRHPSGVLRVDVHQCTTSGRLRMCCWRAVQLLVHVRGVLVIFDALVLFHTGVRRPPQ